MSGLWIFYCLVGDVFLYLAKSSIIRTTIVSARTAMVIMKVPLGKVIEFVELLFVSGAITVEIGAEVIVGFAVVESGDVEVGLEPSGMFIVCVLLQPLSSPIRIRLS